jgi:hypothetical protein
MARNDRRVPAAPRAAAGLRRSPGHRGIRLESQPAVAAKMCDRARTRRRRDRSRRVRSEPARPGPAGRLVVRGSACEAASWTSRSGTPASRAAVMNACRSVCGPTGLAIPARTATRRTIRAAPCRSSRCPSKVRKIGPSTRSPTAKSMARAVRGASGMVTTLPPLRVMTSVRCPRSTPKFSMLALVVSETRSPLSTSKEISACSAGEPSPAATSSAPSSLRSSPVARDS